MGRQGQCDQGLPGCGRSDISNAQGEVGQGLDFGNSDMDGEHAMDSHLATCASA